MPEIERFASREGGCEIVVPVHDGHDATRRCLEALARHTPDSIGIVLVDDASTDARMRPLLDAFAAARPRVRRIDLDRNAGFVGAVNAALDASPADVVVLNSDTRVTPGWIEGLLRCRERVPRLGLACPLSNNATILSIAGVTALLDAPEEIAAALREAGPPTYPRLPTAVGFCMLVARDLLDAAGPLDPVYGRGYGEENDLSMRARRLGFEIACCDDVYVHHDGEASFGAGGDADAVRAANRRRLNRRWPEYEPATAEWSRRNPLRDRLEAANAACERRRFPGRPRVLHVMHAFDSRGGVESHTGGLIEALRERIVSNVVIPGPQPREWGDFEVERRSPTLRVCRMNPALMTPGVRVLEFPASVRDGGVEDAFARFLSGGYDVVHLHGPLGWNTMAIAGLARASGARVVASVHELAWMCADYNMMTGPGERPCGRSVARAEDGGCAPCIAGKSRGLAGAPGDDAASFLAARHATAVRAMEAVDVIVAPSPYAASRVRSAFGEAVAAKVRVIPHGVQPLAPVHRLAPRATLTVGYVGRFGPRKGAHDFIEAARRLAGQGFLFEAWGIVDGRLRAAAHSALVRLNEAYEVARLPQLLRGVDMVLMPSTAEETYGLTLDELHAMGMPVAAARIGALAERVRDGDNGWLFDSGDVDAMVRLLLRLRDDREAIERVARTLRSNPPRTLQQNAAHYGELYEGLAREAPHPFALPAAPAADLVHVVDERRVTPLGGSAYDRWLARSAPPSGEADAFPCVALDGRDAREINAAIAAIDAPWIALHEPGDRIAEGAMQRLREAVGRWPEATIVYGDHDTCSARGERYDPVAKPAFSRELLRHTPYVAGLVLLHRERFVASGGLRIGGWLGVVDWVLRISAAGGEPRVARAVGLLIHRWDANVAALEAPEWRRRFESMVAESLRREGIAASRVAATPDAPAMWAYAQQAPARFTLFLRSAGVDDAVEALRGLLPAAPAIAEIYVDLDEAATSRVREAAATLGPAPVASAGTEPGAALARVADVAQHPWIAVVDARCRHFAAGGLERLLEGVHGPKVAAVAADVAGPRGELRSGARVLGGGPDEVASDAPPPTRDDPLAQLYRAPRDVACLSPWFSVWRRGALRAPGVMASAKAAGAFALEHLGLELHERGHALLSRPFVAASLPADPQPRSAAEADAVRFRERWSARIERDPGFNPALSPSLRPLQLAPRFSPQTECVRICAFPFDGWGSGEMRVRQPCAALEREGWAEAVMMPGHDSGVVPNGGEWRRLGADVLLAHNFFHDYQLRALETYSRDERALRVLGMDDLLTAIPADNPYAGTIYRDIARRIEAAKSRMHRLVVSTEALADAYGAGIEVHVVPNAIDPERWAAIENRRRGDGKPRVGWAGARQHRADLMVLEAVVRATHHDLDWVFLGMCPAALMPFAAEVHPMVPVGRYPSRLAALGLDIAVAPLVDHAFNRAKSPLKLLEYGMLGLPVVASPVGPYRGMPVVHAASADQWIDALMALAGDPGAAGAAGRTLREWVLTHATLPSILPAWRRTLGRG